MGLRRRPVVLAASVAVLLGVALVVMSAGRGPVDQTVPGPVLVVPGYGGGTSGLEVLAQRLRDAGKQVRIVDLPGDGRGDLRKAAEVLDEEAEALLDDGAPSVDVIGYSAGGVTARWWAAELGGADVARRVVTLGSPHHGTPLALPDCTVGCRQLQPGSDLLERLGRDETPDGPAWTTVWTAFDGVVQPPESSRLDGAAEVVVEQVCRGTRVDHGSLTTSPVVAALVEAALAEGPPPGRYACPV